MDFDSDKIDVVFSAGSNREIVAINITDDTEDEGDEEFGLDLKRLNNTPDTVQIAGPTRAFGIIEDNDEPGMLTIMYLAVYSYLKFNFFVIEFYLLCFFKLQEYDFRVIPALLLSQLVPFYL